MRVLLGLQGSKLILYLIFLSGTHSALEHFANLALVGLLFFALAHELLDLLDATHLSLDLLEHSGALLQAKQDIFLDEGKLDVGGQGLELCKLLICARQECFLVFLAAEGEQGAGPVVCAQVLLGNLLLAVGEDFYALLVLVELVALDFQVEDCSKRWSVL